MFADGRVMRRLDGLEKDNTGYDLAGLLCGSEGTLAVITAARLRLVPRPAHVVVALLAFDDVDAALDAVGDLRRALDCLQAVELFFQDGLDLVCDRLGLARPFPARHGAFVLVEAAAGTDPTVELGEAIDRLAGPADVAVAADDRAARDLWRYREAHTEAINLLGPPHKLDVTLPADQLPGFVAEVRDQVSAVAPEAVVWLFGHAADGNIHVNVTGVDPDDDRVTDAVLRLVAPPRIHQRRARNRFGQTAMVAPGAFAHRDRRVPGDQARARSRRRAESARLAAARRRSLTTTSHDEDVRLDSAVNPARLGRFCHTGPWRPAPVWWLGSSVGRTARRRPATPSIFYWSSSLGLVNVDCSYRDARLAGGVEPLQQREELAARERDAARGRTARRQVQEDRAAETGRARRCTRSPRPSRTR